jgi:hypothetical protein
MVFLFLLFLFYFPSCFSFSSALLFCSSCLFAFSEGSFPVYFSFAMIRDNIARSSLNRKLRKNFIMFSTQCSLPDLSVLGGNSYLLFVSVGSIFARLGTLSFFFSCCAGYLYLFRAGICSLLSPL